jgi:hypothetical protein
MNAKIVSKTNLFFFLSLFFLISQTPVFGQIGNEGHPKKERKSKRHKEVSTRDTTINLSSVVVDISCDSLRALFADKKKYSELPPELKYLYSLKIVGCAQEEYNKQKKSKNIVIVRQDGDDPDRIYFDLIDLSDAEKARDALYQTLGIAALIVPGENLKVQIVTAAGRYSIDAFFKAAYKDDPLLVLCPSMIPGNQITKDVINEIKRNKVYDKMSKTWKDNKGTITTIVPGIGITLQTGEKVGKEVERGAQRIEKEVQRFFKKVF